MESTTSPPFGLRLTPRPQWQGITAPPSNYRSAPPRLWRTRLTRVIEAHLERCFRWKAWVTHPFVPVSTRRDAAAPSYG
jgi:hypothetical protein